MPDAPPVDDDGEPITGATSLAHDHTIDGLRALVAGAAQWAEGRQPRSELVDHVAMTNSYALAAVLGMLLATDPAVALRAALIVESIQVDGDVAYLDDLDHGDIVDQAEQWARYDQMWGRSSPQVLARALGDTKLVGSEWPCPTCGAPAKHLHPTTPPGGRGHGQRWSYASLDTGEVDPAQVCPDPWHRPPAGAGDLLTAVAQACGDPGSIVARDADETPASWSGRAVVEVLTQRGVTLPATAQAPQMPEVGLS